MVANAIQAGGYVTAREAAAVIGAGHENTVYALAKAGKIRCYRLGRKVLFRAEWLEEYIAANTTGGPDHPAAGAK